jgi:acyl-coenzyme A synthetase/AMP-(fatty) acid ligase
MSRYLDPLITGQRISGDGWFATRDVGRIDENGELHIVGRLDTRINVGGHKIFAEEIETVLSTATDLISAVGVACAPDPLLGEIPVAIVVPARGVEDVTLAQIRRRFRTTLGPLRTPRRIRVVSDLPHTEYGKLDRTALQQIATATDPL